jgi:hypothetical protein
MQVVETDGRFCDDLDKSLTLGTAEAWAPIGDCITPGSNAASAYSVRTRYSPKKMLMISMVNDASVQKLTSTIPSGSPSILGTE